MHKGVVPTLAGVGVLSGGIMLKGKLPLLGAGLIGYGLAHIVLGSTEFVNEERMYSETCYGVPIGKIKKKIAEKVL